MTLASRLLDKALHLPAPVTRHVWIERDLPVRMRDGVTLLANHYAPRLHDAPTVMVRSPYGRSGGRGLISGRLLAERGFHVVVQSCRGTFGSGGRFDPMRHEREDGLDTIAWIQKQPWFNGDLFTYGPSYVGFTQWAIADAAGPSLKGMLTSVTASSFREPTYSGGAFSFDTVLKWAALLHNQEGPVLSFLVKQARSAGRLERAFAHLPLVEADVVAAGGEIGFFRDWLDASGDASYWARRGDTRRVGAVTAPVCMVGGWYDIFLPWQLRDYATLRAAGCAPRLVVGAWSHASRGVLARAIAEGASWFSAIAGGKTPPGGVELFVGGADEWRTYEQWPPHGRTSEFFLSGGRVSATGDQRAASARFRYDPSDPTPSPGGALLTQGAGQVDNAAVEARADVLVYTGEALSADIEAVGEVRAEMRVRASSPFFDVFVRVCDVDPDGRSVNVCDGLVRATPSQEDDGARPVERTVTVELWPTAYRWRAGHRIRVQVAGAAHPRWSRNTGSGEPLGTARTLVPIDYEILPDSRLILPV